MSTNYSMNKEEARTKVYFTCPCCGKEKWTLKMNFKDGQKCPSCKRKEKIGDFLNSDEFKQKRKETLIKKYGSLENSKKVMAEKSKQAKLLKNNGSYFSDESKDKISNSLKNKSAEEKEKIISQKKQTQMQKYGAYFPESSKKNLGLWAKTSEGKQKISEIKKKECFNHRNSIDHINYEKEIITQRGLQILSIEKDDDNETYFKVKCNHCGNEFIWKMIGDHMRPYCVKCFKAPYSKAEKEIVDFLRSLGLQVEENNRKLLNGKEVDIFIPSKNIAIEYDGLYWHNNCNNSWKFETLRDNGIRLIRITEPEWKTNPDKIKYFLKATFGIFDKTIGARNCEIREISSADYKKFCEENHLQGYSPATIRLGLYYNDELVEIEGFSKPRFSNKYDYELIRECSKNGYNIFGGKSKILKFFKQKYNPKSILSYCEKDKFSGISYFKNGFILDHESKSNYVYYKRSLNGESRLKFQKSKLANILTNYDPSLTEWENMERNGYLRLFDYGQYVFVWYV